MTTEAEVMRLLRRADPDRGRDDVPPVNATDYLAALSTRSTTVTLIDTETDQTSTEGPRRWPIVTVAAAAVVALGIGALILVARDGSETPAPTDTTIAPNAATTAAAVAQSFVDAYVANDAERALAYLTDDVIAAGVPRLGLDLVERPETAEDVRRTLAWNEAAGFKLTVTGCTPIDGSSGTDVTVECSYDVDVLGSDVIGLGPFESGMVLTIRGDKIVSSSHDGSPGGLFEELWQPFGHWMTAEHPDDVAIMYTDGEQNLFNRATTDEALQLWEQRSDDFVQAVLIAREAYPTDVAAVCATAAAELAQLAAPTDATLDEIASWNTAAAAILGQSSDDLTALDKPMATDVTAYSDFYRGLDRLARILDSKADSASGDSARLADVDAQYRDVLQAVLSGPPAPGLDDCLSSLPS